MIRLEKVWRLDIEKQEKSKIYRVASGKRQAVKLFLDPDYYSERVFRGPEQFDIDYGFLDFELESPDFPGIPASVIEGLEKLLSELGLTFETEWEKGKLVYYVGRDSYACKRIRTFRVIGF
ncbi:MAG: hypothetical protein DRP12_01415 [Candidatus Aenigmatarchaeota archaeon]|nr:MAG: hypothetical protein DRP12_01415 [Candidatus Aenigmarchaeota archaeon]